MEEKKLQNFREIRTTVRKVDEGAKFSILTRVSYLFDNEWFAMCERDESRPTADNGAVGWVVMER